MFRYWLFTFLIVTATDAKPNHSAVDHQQFENDATDLDTGRSETIDEIIGSPLDIMAEDLLPEPVLFDIHDAKSEQEPLVEAELNVLEGQTIYETKLGQRSELGHLRESEGTHEGEAELIYVGDLAPEGTVEITNIVNDEIVKTEENKDINNLAPFILWDVPETRNVDNPLWYVENTNDQQEGVGAEGRIKLVNLNFGTVPIPPTLPTLPSLSSLLPTIPTTTELLNNFRRNLITQLELLKGNIDVAIINLKSQLTPVPKTI